MVGPCCAGGWGAPTGGEDKRDTGPETVKQPGPSPPTLRLPQRRKHSMDNSQIPDVHSPDFPNTSVLKWTPDGPTVLANMDRATVTTYTSYLAYTHTYGPHVDRLGDPGGKYFW